MQQWRDISIPMFPGMTAWPGDPVFTLEPAARIADGASCNVSRIALCTHTGTHCDAPWHFIESGKTLDQVEPGVFIGDALVIDVPDARLVRAADLPATPLPERVLFKTRNSDLPVNGPFDPTFTALAEDAAERLVADGVRLAGIDYLSIAAKGHSGPVHRILLGAGIIILEGLRLAGIAPGVHPFAALPLPIVGTDGAPCRAFIRV